MERTCATEIVMKDLGVNQPLPLGKPVTITLTPKKPLEKSSQASVRPPLRLSHTLRSVTAAITV